TPVTGGMGTLRVLHWQQPSAAHGHVDRACLPGCAGHGTSADLPRHSVLARESFIYTRRPRPGSVRRRPSAHAGARPVNGAPLLALLHLCDSLFPLGGFAHSDGLEAATTS